MMRESAYIARKGNQDDQDGFDSLRREGLGLAQDLSGAIWTDYNVHDPGVTILEQLCYALTDLMYRTGFNVEDYLTGEDGHMDFEQLALHPPEQIFPCRPTTHHDYRKRILDSIHEVGNVWVSQANETSYRGLYRISVRLNQDLDEESRADKLDEVRRIYSRARNLCEDLEAVTLVREIECDVSADIEVTGAKASADLLAEIYYTCAKCLAPDAVVHSFEESLAQGRSLDELLRGPLTVHGLIQDQERNPFRKKIDSSRLYTAITTIDGVESIRQLSITETATESTKISSVEGQPEISVRLRIPKNRELSTIKLFKDGKELPFRMQDVRARYQNLNFKNLVNRRSARALSSLCPTPQGQHRNLRAYYSVQNQFPDIYGINRYGVPAAASPDTHARARQLKAYLLLFEQIMANTTATLHELPRLFSLDNQSRQSYFYQALNSDTVPGADSLYIQPPLDVLAKVFRKYDDYTNRKGRLLDYLLAIYGETFPQNSLRQFNRYYSSEQIEDAIIDSKIAFLNSIVDVTQNRAGAFDYANPSWNTGNVAGLMRRVSLLLGFKHCQSRSLTVAILKQGLKLIPHEIYAQVKANTLELKLLDLDDITDQLHPKFQTVPVTGTGPMGRLKTIRRAIKPIIPLQHNLISEALLRGGLTMERYRVGSLTARDNYQLVFQPEGEEQWWYLGAYPDLQSGVRSANFLRQFLIHLNIESEGMHVVEHILLRPVGKPQHESLSFPKGEDFYSLRISVIFPSWTARCHDENFRLLAEETVQQNCPAHIHPDYYWLDFEKMCEFERRYKKWLDAAGGAGTPSTEVNAAAHALIVFLLDHKRPPTQTSVTQK